MENNQNKFITDVEFDQFKNDIYNETNQIVDQIYEVNFDLNQNLFNINKKLNKIFQKLFYIDSCIKLLENK